MGIAWMLILMLIMVGVLEGLMIDMLIQEYRKQLAKVELLTKIIEEGFLDAQ